MRNCAPSCLSTRVAYPAVSSRCLSDTLRLVLIVASWRASSGHCNISSAGVRSGWQRCCSEKLKNVDLSGATLQGGTVKG